MNNKMRTCKKEKAGIAVSYMKVDQVVFHFTFTSRAEREAVGEWHSVLLHLG